MKYVCKHKATRRSILKGSIEFAHKPNKEACAVPAWERAYDDVCSCALSWKQRRASDNPCRCVSMSKSGKSWVLDPCFAISARRHRCIKMKQSRLVQRGETI